MPGHNHFSGCLCGWCFKTGYGSYKAIQIDDTQWRANDEIRSLGISRVSKASCFVNPNAVCPECGARVFYYENEFGSRVYFNDLGGEWPKHSCTSRQIAKVSQHTSKPTNFRSFEEVDRVVSLVRAADIDFDWNFRRDYRREPWNLFRVLRTMPREGKIIAFGVLLNLRDPRNLYVVVRSDECSLKEDDLIGIRRKQVSLLDSASLKRIVIEAETFLEDQAVLNYFGR